ncbi:hypothetical protein NE604_02540 [Anaerofustis stercorihominis]|uniref:Uncharacterized protein n=1 Tax=Anaerofustis stercorihominis DSM 17244 TaxID=445971 RepID=B1C879_9FIRM|nr:hypothetical protein [Anaerofustis stercorihominis]EDS73216.1 hypothetical protein ANASTE_00936 [Anaerofustis stercorihominis DSM 17244]MCQ4794515.1 hypothetical protein [Anaerofustis stercorihominis]
MAETLYTLHFNYSYIPILLIPLIVSIGFFTFNRWYTRQNSGVNEPRNKLHKKYIANNILTKAVGLITFILFIYTSAGYLIDYFDLKEKYETDNYKTISGYVERFHALKKEGHDSEHFYIDDIYFEYSNREMMSGYNIPLYKNGAIKINGQYLIIKYVTYENGENVIIEIKEDKIKEMKNE